MNRELRRLAWSLPLPNSHVVGEETSSSQQSSKATKDEEMRTYDPRRPRKGASPKRHLLATAVAISTRHTCQEVYSTSYSDQCPPVTSVLLKPVWASSRQHADPYTQLPFKKVI